MTEVTEFPRHSTMPDLGSVSHMTEAPPTPTRSHPGQIRSPTPNVNRYGRFGRVGYPGHDRSSVSQESIQDGPASLDARGQIRGQLSFDALAETPTLEVAAGGPDAIVALFMQTFPGSGLSADPETEMTARLLTAEELAERWQVPKRTYTR